MRRNARTIDLIINKSGLVNEHIGFVRRDSQRLARLGVAGQHHLSPLALGAHDLIGRDAVDSLAALQADNASPYPILLATSSTSGHGIGDSLDEKVAKTADWLSFLFDQLGMTLKAN